MKLTKKNHKKPNNNYFIFNCFLEIVNELKSATPADRLFQNFSIKKNLGSKNRKALSELFFSFIRNYWCCSWLKDISHSLHSCEPTEAMCVIFFIINDLDIPEEDRSKFNPSFKEFIKEQEKDKPIWAKANMSEAFWNIFSKTDCCVEEALSLKKEANIDIRVNEFLGFSKSEVIQNFCLNGIFAEEIPYTKSGLRINKRIDLTRNLLYKSGAFEIQDASSQILSELCAITENITILDYCAGAGGKSIGVLNAYQDLKKIKKLALTDISNKRLSQAQNRFSRFDSNKTYLWAKENIIDFVDIKNINTPFDLVIVDAPCSGIGTLKRNPWLITNPLGGFISPENKISILNNASKFVGKYMIYMTCSLLSEENENIIESFLDGNKDFYLLNARDLLKRKVNNKLVLDALIYKDYFIKPTPYKFGTDGFFFALLERKP